MANILTMPDGLLARIHRDGGQHTDAVGLAQSVADAEQRITEWLARDDVAGEVECLQVLPVNRIMG